MTSSSGIDRPLAVKAKTIWREETGFGVISTAGIVADMLTIGNPRRVSLPKDTVVGRKAVCAKRAQASWRSTEMELQLVCIA